MPYVLRQIMPQGGTARANSATIAALTEALVRGMLAKGQYLAWADPDARDGWGDDGWTDDIDKALKFASFADAAAYWKQQSTSRPIRPDGKPNRPLTAYSITIERIEESGNKS